MLWSLFAATPAIARVWSPRYEASVWCRREAELSGYLAEANDFMAERWVIDVEHGDLRELDRVTNAWNDGDEEVFEAPGGLFREFPPLCMVWTPTPMPEWEVKMLRASAALRLMNVLVADPATTNSLARFLESGADVPIPAPTNNPDGWRAYADILRDARLGDGADEPAVQLPSDYGTEQRALDAALSQRIPDLSSGTPALRDVLVALEWLRVEWPALLEYRGVDLVAINCRDFSRADWQNDERLSLLRGLAVVRLYGPLWFLQLAGQDVETWPFVGERPIFTEHVSSQYAWMSEIFPERSAAQDRYAHESGMILSAELAGRCRQAAVEADAS